MGENWLDLPRITSSTKLPNERKRAPSMQQGMQRGLGKKRVWACDGEFVWFRRKKANPATLARHETFLRTGDYKFIGTSDDVETYQLMETSAFKRPQKDLTTLDAYNVRREATLAACRRDWSLFVDALSELATRIKSQYHEAFANEIYKDNLTAVFLAVNMRGGPSQQEIDREVRALRQRRGDSVNRVLVMPVSVA